MLRLALCLSAAALAAAVPADGPKDAHIINEDFNRIKDFLADYNKQAQANMSADTNAQWNAATNTTPYWQNIAAHADANLAAFQQDAAAYVKKNLAPIMSSATANQKRQLNMTMDVGIKLSGNDTITLSNYVAKMNTIYSNAQICGYTNGQQNCSVKWSLDPDLFNLLASNTDYDTLTYVWQQWRQKLAVNNVTYANFVKLSNKGARAGGYNDTGAFWRSWYESKNFTQNIQSLYYQILPLYEQLHTYVRRQLITKYGSSPHYGPPLSTIPAQLLGNMWAQEWENIYSWTMPYNGLAALDVSDAMVAQNYTPKMMFQKADQFFQSIGFPKMDAEFWQKSIITKPNRNPLNFVCHASAWDFYNASDYRIKMCTSVSMDNLITIHHEMGHIQYYMHYSKQPIVYRCLKRALMCTSVSMDNLITIHHEMGHIQYFMHYSKQPIIYRNGANPGFHEAIGDTIAKSVSTPGHLQKIGLLTNYTQSNAQDVNYLYKQALEKIAFLPWGYLMDAWRWQVFDGTANTTNWNQKWWQLRYQLQGLNAPGKAKNGAPGSSRPAGAFDPAAKSHIDDNTPYIRYFVSFIVQFQFYEQMCNASGYTGPLYQCDFFNSTAAGNVLGNMLKLGSSLPWQQAMQQMTGQPNMDAGSLLKYFQPLTDWLKTTNAANCECYGWGNDDMYPASVTATLLTPRCGSTPTSGSCNTGGGGNSAPAAYASPVAVLLSLALAALLKLF